MNLLWKIERFLQSSGMPPTTFGRAACRDPRLVHDLRNGREPGRRIVAKVIGFIETWR